MIKKIILDLARRNWKEIGIDAGKSAERALDWFRQKWKTVWRK
jgi:hypothetical protein